MSDFLVSQQHMLDPQGQLLVLPTRMDDFDFSDTLALEKQFVPEEMPNNNNNSIFSNILWMDSLTKKWAESSNYSQASQATPLYGNTRGNNNNNYNSLNAGFFPRLANDQSSAVASSNQNNLDSSTNAATNRIMAARDPIFALGGVPEAFVEEGENSAAALYQKWTSMDSTEIGGPSPVTLPHQSLTMLKAQQAIKELNAALGGDVFQNGVPPPPQLPQPHHQQNLLQGAAAVGMAQEKPAQQWKPMLPPPMETPFLLRYVQNSTNAVATAPNPNADTYHRAVATASSVSKETTEEKAPPTTRSTKSPPQSPAKRPLEPSEKVAAKRTKQNLKSGDDNDMNDSSSEGDNDSDETGKSISSIVKPLSPYNFFFSEMREQLLEEQAAEASGMTKPFITPTQQKRAMETPHERKNRLLQQHLTKDRSKRRPHRKTHGKFSFTTLSKLISTRWRSLSPSEKQFYKDVAHADLQRYRRQLDKLRKR